MRVTAFIALLGALALALPASASAASPNLRTTISDAPDPVGAGNALTYTIDLKNTGTAAAQNVALKAPLPAGTQFDIFQATGPWTISGDSAGTITATTSSFAAGATAEFVLRVRVNASVASGTTIKESASVSSNPADPFPRDNTASTTTTVERVALTVVNADTPDPVAPGHDITYSVGLVNNGKAGADFVSLTDDLPAGTTYVSSSAPAGWFINDPPVGGTGNVTFSSTSSTPPQFSASFSLTVHVDPATAEGTTISDTASVMSPSSEDDTTDNSATATTLVSSKPDLETAMTVTPTGAADPGSDLTYALTVTNRGDADAQDITLSDPLPPGTTFVSAAQTKGAAFFCNLPTPGATGTINCNRTTLGHAEYATFTVVLHVDPGAGGRTVDNTATAATSTAELDPANDSATRSTHINGSGSLPPPVGGAADLAIVKPSAASVRHGHKKTLRVAVANRGSAVATAARLTVKLPKRLQLVKAKGCTAKNGLVACQLGDLAAGGRSAVTLVVRPKRRGTYRLKALVATATRDPNAANNAATFTLKAR
jgi:uncharacterized repeat protein (TIGR01451 family)